MQSVDSRWNHIEASMRLMYEKLEAIFSRDQMSEAISSAKK